MCTEGVSDRCRRRPTLPRPLGRSTIGAVGLNDRVRNGNGCGPYALVASDVRKTSEEVIVIVGDRSQLDRSVLSAPEGVRRNLSSQASRAIRTAALGTGCPDSTCGLLTG